MKENYCSLQSPDEKGARTWGIHWIYELLVVI